MDQFLETYNLPKFILKGKHHLNIPIFIKEIESILTSLPKQKAPGSDGEFYQVFKEEFIAIRYNVFQRTEQR